MAGRRRWGPASLIAAEDEGNILPKALLHSSKFSEAKWLKTFNLCIINKVSPFEEVP